MKSARKRDSLPRILGEPSNCIPEYGERSVGEQLRLFSELIQKQGGYAVRKLWRRLDPWTQYYVMQRLGCLAGTYSPRGLFLPRLERDRAVGAEARTQIKTVKKFIQATEESVRRSQRLDFCSVDHERLIAESRVALARLEDLEKECTGLFSGPRDLDIRNIVKAQEFVKRRSAFLGTPVNLTAAAIADILDLNELGLEKKFQDKEGAVRKALCRFREKPDYQAYMDEIGELLPDWTLPNAVEEVGQTAP